MEKIVLNLEASKAIKEFLGEECPESVFFWTDCEFIILPETASPKWRIHTQGIGGRYKGAQCISAFTFSELITDVLPLIVKKNQTINDVLKRISNEMRDDVSRAYIWGKNARFPGQEVSFKFPVFDEMEVCL